MNHSVIAEIRNEIPFNNIIGAIPKIATIAPLKLFPIKSIVDYVPL